MTQRHGEPRVSDAEREEPARPLSDDEIESEEATELPDREALSIVDLGDPGQFTLPYERGDEI